MTLPFPTLAQAIPGNTVTSALWNTSVYNGLTYLSEPPIAVLAQATTQSIPNSALTAVSYDTTVVDTYGGHSNTVNPSRYTAQVAGWVWVIGINGLASNATGVRVAEIFKNGSPIAYTQTWAANTGANPCTSMTATLVFLNIGDYVETNVYQTSGGALSTFTTGPQSSMCVYWAHL